MATGRTVTNNIERRVAPHIIIIMERHTVNRNTINANLINAQYAVRGELAIRAEEIRKVSSFIECPIRSNVVLGITNKSQKPPI